MLARMWDSLPARKMKARFAALRLESFANKHRNSSNGSASSSPFCMGVLPISSRRPFRKECVDGESPIGEIHVAVPFAWEVTPGTPKRGGGSEDLEDMMQKLGSASPEKLSPQSSSSEHDFSDTTNFISIRGHTRRMSSETTTASADELFHYNQLLPLQLPPRLHAVKHRLQELRELRECAACSCLDAVTPNSPSKQASSQSGHSKLKMRVSFCGMSKMSHSGSRGGVVVWPRPEADSNQRGSARAKLQNLMSKLKRDEPKSSALFSDRLASSSESANASSASPSSSTSFEDDKSRVQMLKEKLWPSFAEKKRKNKTWNRFVTSSEKPRTRMDISKISSKELLSNTGRFEALSKGLKSLPRMVQSKRELEAKLTQDKRPTIEHIPERKCLTPLLSRSNAKSRSRCAWSNLQCR